MRLKEIRKEKRISQREAAEFLGVSQTAISQWENGIQPPMDKVVKLADLYGVSLDYIFERDQHATSEAGPETRKLKLIQNIVESQNPEEIDYLISQLQFFRFQNSKEE